MEGEFSKYLISNAEMEQYEAEYKRCASIIANGSIEQLATTSANSPGTDQNSIITAAASAAALAAAAANGMLNTATVTMAGYTNTAETTVPPQAPSPQLSTSGKVDWTHKILHCKYLQPIYIHRLCYISICNLAVIIAANGSKYDIH